MQKKSQEKLEINNAKFDKWIERSSKIMNWLEQTL